MRYLVQPRTKYLWKITDFCLLLKTCAKTNENDSKAGVKK